MDDDVGYTTATRPAPAPPPTRTPSSIPIREDCWSEYATDTLVRAWGNRYLELNRGNLRHNDWQEVADAVNAVHGHTKKSRRSDVQCKNRIDTLKKKYKVEKARVSDDAGGAYVSDWPFFPRLDRLIGPAHKSSPPVPPRRKTPPAPVPEMPQWTVPVGPRSKRPAPAASTSAIRMQFAKDLEVQRMRIFMDAQIQMEKIRRGKRKQRSSESGEEFVLADVCFFVQGLRLDFGDALMPFELLTIVTLVLWLMFGDHGMLELKP
ncbi:hypothetical protein RHMOL_Rhmol06G0184400 [Rhododendron molle]|uniref:Uncharacterized protein n=1 Tax=Rhododendron molle TaxID=49168 RepID=A0ACC0NDU4_RHOML|nr:hypothetical protein RHMOL_Rhmol06G0184400 [Rhododendron molle]